ncbi:MAG: dihydrolipoyl dehydrogenase family protein [Brevinema sp.]
MPHFDVIVLGGGAAGLTCAIGAAKIGKKTLIIERNKLGGECTWQGCVPSKAFIHSQSFEKTRAVSEAVYLHENPEVMKGFGIEVLEKEAVFINSKTLEADGELYTADNFVIATGAESIIPPIKGLKDTPYLYNESFFKLKEIPRSIIFIGGGVISLELVFPLAKSGAKVTILEKLPKLLINEDPDVQRTMMQSLQDHGVTVITNVNIIEMMPKDPGVEIKYSQDGKEESILAEYSFISAGRRARTEGYGLDKAGVTVKNTGIQVNSFMQTTQSHIYAAGDCVDGFRFSHVAGRHGQVITRNIAFPLVKQSYENDTPPFIVFTDPEYSRCGLTLSDAWKKFGDSLHVYQADAEHADRAISSFDKHFLLKVYCVKGKIVGAFCLGERAGEIITPIQFLMRSKIPFKKFASVMQAYPGYGEVISRLAKSAMIDDLLENPIVKMFRKK